MRKIGVVLALFLIGGYSGALVAKGKKKEKVALLKVKGMVCQDCAAKVEEALEDLDFVKGVDISLKKGIAKVEIDPKKAKEHKESHLKMLLVKAVKKAGYKATFKKWQKE